MEIRHPRCKTKDHGTEERSKNKSAFKEQVSDPYNALLKSPENWVVYSPIQPKQPGFFSLLILEKLGVTFCKETYPDDDRPKVF